MSISELKVLKNPPVIIKDILDALYILMNDKIEKDIQYKTVISYIGQ